MPVKIFFCKAIQVNLKAFDLERQWQSSVQVCSPVPTRPPELRANYLVTIEPAWCKGCAICLDVCPERCFVLDEQDIAVAVHQERCTGCQLCVKLCPDFAIEVGLAEQIRERESTYHAG